MYLFLDTETTGLSPQDRIVSICWVLYDAEGQHASTNHRIIYSDGFTIPYGATAIHGITTDTARRKGIPLADALLQLHQHIAGHSPALYVGHNVSFDRPIVLNEYRRTGL
jgi:DNA polymerase-3 subunit alpha